MIILKPGEPCPCCGQPIRDDLPRRKLLLLSYIAEGLSLMDTINAMAEVMELPPPGGVMAEMSKGTGLSATPEGPATDLYSLTEGQSDAGEKRAIVQRLKDYRAASGLGSQEAVSVKTAHFKGQRVSTDQLRDICADRAPKLEMDAWRKISRALDILARKEAADGNSN